MAAYERSTSRSQSRMTISYLKGKDIPTSKQRENPFSNNYTQK